MSHELRRRDLFALRLPHLKVNLAIMQVVAVIASAITFAVFGAAGSGYSSTAAKGVLERAYHQGVAQGTTPTVFPSREQAIALLSRDGGLHALNEGAAAAYHDLRAHGGQEGTVYVKSVSPKRLELVARVHHDAIEELDVTLPRPGSDLSTFHKIYDGHFNWSGYQWVALGEELGALLIAVLLGFVDAKPSVEQRRSWLEIVNDPQLGPFEPEKGHVVLLPVCKDEGDGVTMDVQRLSWNGKDWHRQTPYASDWPAGLKRQQVKRSEGVPAASERWFDFCAQVADWNARQWQETCKQRERQAAAKRQAAEQARLSAIAKEAAAAEAAREQLAPVLAPATTLMRQALAAKPLPAIESE